MATEAHDNGWGLPKNILGIANFSVIVIGGLCAWYRFDRFDETLSTLEIQRREIELESVRITPEDVLEVTDLGAPPDREGEHLFYVAYKYRFENRGMQKVEVTRVVVSAYSASPRLGNSSHLHVNEIGEDGEIEWTLLQSQGWMYGPRWKDDSSYYDDDRIERPLLRGGGGTSELHAGEVSDGDFHMILSSRANELVGFKLNVAFNGGLEDADRWQNTRWKLLAMDEGEYQ